MVLDKHCFWRSGTHTCCGASFASSYSSSWRKM
ncbi:hypothetical protein M758_4G053300 [Ceratodon purpureus]|nr:hypothetical protein M758_N027700 [Ceratodon purpureus]KAG0614095.1 hypothetical protein M758_6G151000 [Ceratodon purpureus]KAG0618303.1 hypothetical protein M758_4G053300 [Ceratodon purpureus]